MIYILLGIITAILNVRTIFKYKPNVVMTVIFVVIGIVGLGYAVYWWNEFRINTLPFLDDPTQLAKDVIKQLWQEGKTNSGYEQVNYKLYVYYFLEYVVGFILINLPQYVYRRMHKKGVK